MVIPHLFDMIPHLNCFWVIFGTLRNFWYKLGLKCSKIFFTLFYLFLVDRITGYSNSYSIENRKSAENRNRSRHFSKFLPFLDVFRYPLSKNTNHWPQHESVHFSTICPSVLLWRTFYDNSWERADMMPSVWFWSFLLKIIGWSCLQVLMSVLIKTSNLANVSIRKQNHNNHQSKDLASFLLQFQNNI